MVGRNVTLGTSGNMDDTTEIEYWGDTVLSIDDDDCFAVACHDITLQMYTTTTAASATVAIALSVRRQVYL